MSLAAEEWTRLTQFFDLVVSNHAVKKVQHQANVSCPAAKAIMDVWADNADLSWLI